MSLDQDAPEALRRVRFIGPRRMILREWNG